MTTILVIDDEEGIRDNIVDTLEAENYTVVSAANGVIGLQVALQKRPDLIICDALMPVMNGFELLEKLRENKEVSTTPFIFLTALSERDDQRQAMNLGADDFISKPFTSYELLAAVSTRLKKQTQLSNKFETTLHLLRRNIVFALPHEFRTPLTHVLGYADLLSTDVESLSTAEIRQYAEAISKAGKRLERLTENYLSVAQLDILTADKKQLHALQNHIIDKPGEIIYEQAQKMARQYKREAAGVMVAYDHLKKIAEELIDNAFKFSKPGSAVIVQGGRDMNHYIFCVRDYGRGMTREQIDSIGAYMQFERAVYEQQGLGLGLVIVKRLAELHAGQLLIKSTPGEGTLVCAKLPA
jgi:DNA-binding response OmpR family regulator